MTVLELIEKLRKCEPDAIAMVQGYEAGYSDIASINEIKVTLNVNKEHWNGSHEQLDDSKISAVIFIREVKL